MVQFFPNIRKLVARKDIAELAKHLSCSKAFFTSTSKLDRIRADCANALGKLKDPLAVEPLLATLQDNSTTVRLAVIKSLSTNKIILNG